MSAFSRQRRPALILFCAYSGIFGSFGLANVSALLSSLNSCAATSACASANRDREKSSAQVAPPKVGYKSPPQRAGVINAASRELGIERTEAQRAVKIDALPDEVKREAKILHLDDNQTDGATEGGEAVRHHPPQKDWPMLPLDASFLHRAAVELREIAEREPTHLKRRMIDLSNRPVKKPAENERVQIGWSSSGPIYEDEMAERSRVSRTRLALIELADVLGDVDGFIEQYDEKTRSTPKIAAEIARRLLTGWFPCQPDPLNDVVRCPCSRSSATFPAGVVFFSPLSGPTAR